jgi:hypothetical protein
MKVLTIWIWAAILMGCRHPGEDVVKDANGVVTRLPYYWKSSTSQAGGLNSTMFAQHIYQDQYLLTAQRLTAAGATVTANPICFKRVGDGSPVWCWNDRFSSQEAAVIFDYNITTSGDWLLYNYGSRSYCINQQTGQTVWKKEWGGGLSNMLTTTSLD